jgi:paraquat-inducible protein A
MFAPMNEVVHPGASHGDLIACSRCDMLHRAVVPPDRSRSRCRRCGTVLIAPRRTATVHVLGLAVAVAVLMIAAVFLPFITITASGLRSTTSIFDAAMAFDDGILAPLAVGVLAFIVLVPLARVTLTLWALGPLVLGLPNLPGALWAFRWEEELKPWAMTEIFIIGVAIALVKITELAAVSLGPAFWLLSALVIVNVAQDGLMDRWCLWRELERAPGRAGRRRRGAAPA